MAGLPRYRSDIADTFARAEITRLLQTYARRF